MTITANLVFDEAKTSIFNRNIDIIADTIKALLANTVWTPSQGGDSFIDAGGASDAIDARVTGTTDQTIGSKSITKDATNHFAYLSGANVTFSAVASGSTVAGVAVYKDTGTTTTSKLIAVYDITDIPTNGGDVTIQWASAANGGVLKLA